MPRPMMPGSLPMAPPGSMAPPISGGPAQVPHVQMSEAQVASQAAARAAASAGVAMAAAAAHARATQVGRVVAGQPPPAQGGRGGGACVWRQTNQLGPAQPPMAMGETPMAIPMAAAQAPYLVPSAATLVPVSAGAAAFASYHTTASIVPVGASAPRAEAAAAAAPAHSTAPDPKLEQE